MAPLLLLALAIALSSQQAARADDQVRSYDCKPLRPFFCRNIHVACSGRTRLPTAPFRVSIAGDLAKVEFEGPEPSGQGRVSGSGDLVIRLDTNRSWIRIQPDGRYSHRVYWGNGAAMSQGTCKATPAQ